MTTREDFIKQYLPIANNISTGTNIFPSVIVAAAILESQGFNGETWEPGTSQLSKKYNNFFGIKAGYNWKGNTVNLNTGEVINGQTYIIPDNFRVYESPADSFKDYVNFLKENPRYTAAGVFSADSSSTQADRIAQAGYATNPNYANLLKSIIREVESIPPAAYTGGAIVALILLFYFFFSKHN